MEELYILLYLLENKENYLTYTRYIDVESLPKRIQHLYFCVDKLYNSDDKLNHIPIDLLEASVYSNYPAMKPADRELVEAMFTRLRSVDMGEYDLTNLLRKHRDKAIAFRLIEKATSVYNGSAEFGDITRFLEDAKKDLPDADESDPFLEFSLSQFSETYLTSGLKFPLKTLSVMLGSLRTGDFGCIFSRPEVGKTTMLANIGVCFCQQLDGLYIHFNNEEEGRRVYARYVQAALGLPTKDLIDPNHVQEYEAKFMDKTKGNFKMVDEASISRKMVEDICQRFKPKVIIIDSIDKVKGFKLDPHERDDLHYKKLYQWARELSKEYGPVIGTCHASAEAENQQWLDMDHVAYAKTAKQGELDWLLGIGKRDEPGKETIRYLHVSKNKLLGDSEFQEEFRHGRLPVRLLSDVALYEDIQDF